MNVLLVNPPRINGVPCIREDRCENLDIDANQPPTSLVYLAGILRQDGHETRLIDASGYDLHYDYIDDYMKRFNPDYVIFRSAVSTFEEDTITARLSQKHGAKSILLNWNLHGVLENIVKQKCPELDRFLGIYHYEEPIRQIVANGIDYDYTPKNTRDIPTPAWDFIPDFRPYFTRTRFLSPWTVIRGSKGCSFICHFCVDQNLPWFPRSPELIVDEIEYLVKQRGVRYISWFDDTWEVNEKWCLKILDEIEKRKLNFEWFINSRSDLIVRRGLDFFKRCAKMGLSGSSLGVEFGTDAMLRASGKHTTVAQNTQAVDILHKAGVKSYCSLLMGYLNENKEQMLETMKWIIRTKPTAFQINIVYPIFSTTLYEQAKQLGLIDESKLNWKGLSCVPTDVVPVQLTQYSGEELQKLRNQMYRRIYTSNWAFYNAFKWGWRNPKLTLGYALSGIGRLRHGFSFSH